MYVQHDLIRNLLVSFYDNITSLAVTFYITILSLGAFVGHSNYGVWVVSLATI